MIPLVAIIIFLGLIIWLVILHIVLSWLPLLGLNIRVQFVNNIIEPIYEKIEKIIPTKIGPFSFTPIIVILLVGFIKGSLYILFPELPAMVPDLFR